MHMDAFLDACRGRMEQYRCILDIFTGSVLSNNVVELFGSIALFVSNQEEKNKRCACIKSKTENGNER